MVNWKSKQLGDVLMLANGFVLLLLINLLASYYFVRLDLTEEKRFSIKEPTKAMLEKLEEPVYIEVFLAGDLNPSFTRFQRSIKEILEEFRVYSGGKVRFVFTDPATAMGEKARNEFMQDLASRGVQPRNVINNKDGQRVEKIIFPGALISYEGFETGVNLLKGNSAAGGSEGVINQAIEGVEYELANAIYKLSNNERKQVGLVQGHAELSGAPISSLRDALQDKFDVDEVLLNEASALNSYDALIIAKPQQQFSEPEKFVLDQYLMQGGNLLLLIDKLEASADSASRDDYFAFPYDLNLDDQLFKYGFRINLDLIQDRAAALFPVVTGMAGNKPQIQLMDWPFFPLVNRYAEHEITRNLDAVLTRFVSSIDTVKVDNVKRTPVLFSSQYARTLTAPVRVSINDIRNNLKAEDFQQAYLPIAYLAEGTFPSLFKNRFIPEGVKATTILESSKPAKIILISDGDMARNDVNPRTGQAQVLGFDRFSNYTFANLDLLVNGVSWLVDDNGLLTARTKEVKIRPLDKEKIKQERLYWQLLNVAAPILIIVLFGIVWVFIRRKKFASF
ncbi:MAG: gliding motility-associated ABC transporter substrate-binding protein GldG [Cytophagia bacterium]|nr:gliding motility-associated ABC transporter substrate-binding protein GldG [Cytophagia bacterium]NBW37961.1 gliding motility-associated ABC transporter substrate-binding protein GldG [Cytophagia bacterium]